MLQYRHSIHCRSNLWLHQLHHSPIPGMGWHYYQFPFTVVSQRKLKTIRLREGVDWIAKGTWIIAIVMHNPCRPVAKSYNIWPTIMLKFYDVFANNGKIAFLSLDPITVGKLVMNSPYAIIDVTHSSWSRLFCIVAHYTFGLQNNFFDLHVLSLGLQKKKKICSIPWKSIWYDWSVPLLWW